MDHSDRTYLLVGASRGIGGEAAVHFVARGARVISVSRTPARAGRWVQADVATDAGIDRVVTGVGPRSLDALLFLGGTWEAGAFTSTYDFRSSSRDETRAVLAVNLIAPILLAQALAPALQRSGRGRIVLNGASSGLSNAASREVANTASKFGLRGAAEALHLSLADEGIGVTVVNLDNVATPEVVDDIEAGRFGPQVPIPIEDVLRTYDYVLSLDSATVPRSIDLRQRAGETTRRP